MNVDNFKLFSPNAVKTFLSAYEEAEMKFKVEFEKYAREKSRFEFLEVKECNDFKGDYNFNYQRLFMIVDKTTKKELKYFFLNTNDITKFINSRYIELHKYYEGRYSDEIMVSCHGKNWKTKDEKTGKPASPYYLDKYPVVFDTFTGEIIYESEKEHYRHPYFYFYENVLEIVKDGGNTIFFDMPNRKIILETSGHKLYSNENIIIGNDFLGSKYNKDKSAVIINKITCETTVIK